MKRSVVALFGLAAALAAWAAAAQHVDPRRPATFVVGAPGGAAPMQRVDARRSGMATDPLPAGALRVAWKKSIGLSIDQPALAGRDGTLAIVSTRGDVVFIDESGDEQARITVGAGSVGPAAITSDGTIVFTTSGGEVVGVKRSSGPNQRPLFATRIGGERNIRAAPLALDDGGVVVATAHEVVVLDSRGNIRARTSIPETIFFPLLASGERVIVIGTSGAVFGWTPGREPSRVGSFGAPVDGGAALVGPSTLVGVIDSNQLVELDLARGVRSTRAIAAQGLYLGPPAVRPGPKGGSIATVLAMTPSRAFVVSIDAGGHEVLRAPIASMAPQTYSDGGAAPLVAPPHTGPLVDRRGAIAFASTDGRLGVVTPEGAVETIGDTLCARTVRSSGSIAGITPFGRSSFAATCYDGMVVRIVGPGASPGRARRADAPLERAAPGSSAEPEPGSDEPQESLEPDDAP